MTMVFLRAVWAPSSDRARGLQVGFGRRGAGLELLAVEPTSTSLVDDASTSTWSALMMPLALT
jgi:hypothetical protein